MLFDRTVRINFVNNKTKNCEIQFTTRHLISPNSRKGNTILVVNAPISNPIYTSRTDKTDNYDRRKGVITCLQKYIWKHFQLIDQVTYDIVSVSFQKDGSLDISVTVRNEETAKDGMWWLKSILTTSKVIF